MIELVYSDQCVHGILNGVFVSEIHKLAYISVKSCEAIGIVFKPVAIVQNRVQIYVRAEHYFYTICHALVILVLKLLWYVNPDIYEKALKDALHHAHYVLALDVLEENLVAPQRPLTVLV